MQRVRPALEYSLDTIHEAVITFGEGWRYTYVNRAAAELIGLPAEALLGNTVWETFPRLVGSTFYTALHQVAADRRHRTFLEQSPTTGQWLETDAHPTSDGVIVVIRDVTDQKLADQKLQSKFRQLQVLFELSGAVSRAQVPDEIYHAAVQGLVSAVGADRASVLMFDPDEVLRFKAWIGLSDQYRTAVEGHTPWRRGVRDAQPLAISDVTRDPCLADYRKVFAQEGIRAVAFIPLLGNGGLIGKFMLYYNAPHEFQTDELQVAQTIATHVAFAAERQLAETALRNSEERLRATFYQAAVGISQSGLDLKWLLRNDRYCEIVGYTQAELSQKTFLDITHPDDRAASLAVIHRLLAGEVSSHSLEKRYIRKDGEVVWARVFVSLVRDPENRPQNFICVMEDITERVQAERALRNSEQRLNLVQSAAHLGICEWDFRTDTITYSGEYARLYGLAPDHPLSREQLRTFIHPDDQEHVQAQIREAHDRNHAWNTEYRVRWPDGSVHWLLSKGTVFVDDSNRPVRSTGVVLDITEGKRAESALRESEERFRNLADTAPVMIWVAGTDKVLTFFNKTWLAFVGRTMEQELGNGWIESVHPDDLDRCFASYSAAFDARQNFDIEYRLRRADGEYRWVLCSGVPRFEPGGDFAGYIGSDIDLTDLRRTREEAFERQKLESLGVLTSGIAHDFNNLLGSILAEAELAGTELAAGASPSEEIQRIEAVAIRASEIVRELMIYSGQDTANLAPVDVSRLVEEMLELLKVSISKHATLKADLPKNLPVVLGNAPQIRQIVMNLIINASEAIGEKDGEISVATSRFTGNLDLAPRGQAGLPDCDYLRLEVSDTGGGLTADVRAKIFDPFFTTKFAGRGLGLAVVQGIVRAHGGAIDVVSTPDRTTFQILLPCAGQAAAQNHAMVSALADRIPVAGATILVVEDEDTLRFSVSKILGKKGFSVVEAGDGSVAIDFLRSHKGDIDIILLDMTIPGASSRDVLAEAQRLRPATKVILTSAYSREMVTASVDTPQIKGFIRKPFRLDDLVGLLRNTLSIAE
jgi:two-component system cell cycle sensor histidine kinase/response regulator CckA